MTSLRQQLQQQPQVCVAPPWLSTLLRNCHDCYCTSREGTGIFLVRGAGTSALTGTIPNPLCTVRRGAAQWGCPLAPVKAVLWSTWGGACSRGVWCHGAVPTGVCRGLLCRRKEAVALVSQSMGMPEVGNCNEGRFSRQTEALRDLGKFSGTPRACVCMGKPSHGLLSCQR